MALSNGDFETKSKFHGEEEGLGFVRFTRGLGRKRILISKSNQEINSNSDQAPAPTVEILLKRQKSETTESNKSSLLESLHQDILIRVVCHVDHEDLATLKRVSKTIRKAVLEAKKSHFDYSTPKKTLRFRDPLLILEESNSNSSDQDDEMEAPNAPIRRRNITRESDLSKISMVLFK